MRKVVKIFVFSLILCICASFFVGTETQAKIKKGKWKDNISWSYDTKTKELVISGSGRIAECTSLDSETNAPGWYKYSDKAKKMRIVGNITNTGASISGVSSFKNLQRLIITDSVQRIGAFAFKGLAQVDYIRLPSKLEVLGQWSFAFSGAKKLYIPANVKKMGASAFAGNERLSKVKIEDGVEKIGPSVFWSCIKLKKLKLPNSVRILNDGCFALAGLKKITIPKNVEEIGERAFAQASVEEATLKKVTIKSKKIKKWEKDIFANAHKELVIYVPKSKKKQYEKALRSKGLPTYVKVVGEKSLD